MNSSTSSSLDNWREYFGHGADIFDIINHAIMVASEDYPQDFKSKRDSIAELLFSRQLKRDHLDHKEAKTVVDISGGEYDNGYEAETRSSNNQIVSSTHTYEEAFMIVNDVKRIKDILLNKEESNSILLKSLTNLESMSMSVDILKETGIGKAVNGLRKHSYDKISKLAKTLVAEWKEMVEQWSNNTLAGNNSHASPEETQESANLSPPEAKTVVNIGGYEAETRSSNNQIVSSNYTYEEAFTTVDDVKRIKDILLNKDESNSMLLKSLTNLESIPMNVDILKETGIGKAVNGLRKHSSDKISKLAKTLVAKWKEMVEQWSDNTLDGNNSHASAEETQETANMSPPEEEVSPSPSDDLDTFANELDELLDMDEPRTQPKQIREPMIPRKLRVVFGRQPTRQHDNVEGLNSDAKFEVAKRKIHESYQVHENAKRQKRVQVVDYVPEQRQLQKPQFKRLGRR